MHTGRSTVIRPRARLAALTVAAVVAAAVCLTPRAGYAQSPTPGTLQVGGTVPETGPEGGAPAAGVAPRRTASPVRTDRPPTIDGHLDDAVWADATLLTGFVQRRPLDGAPASERTEIRVAYDANNLYFGIYAHYSDRNLIRANRVDRDRIWNDDTVRIYLDPFLDQQRAYVFAVNGYGVQGDALMSGGGGGRGRGGGGGGGGGRGGPGGGVGDTSWDALFRSAGELVDDGWTAEVAIPFKSLRYPARGANEAHRWGMQIERTIESRNESAVWAPVSRDIPGILRQMGYLSGMTNLSASRNLEFQPTLTAIGAETLADTGGYLRDHTQDAGLNVKYGVTSNLTADFTVNPDFSQIESDRPQILTNQRYPVFYPEQRPFFLAGQEAFQVAAPVTAIHTRTIVDPRYGAKMTGKVGRTLLGVLVANDQAPGNVDDPNDPAYGHSAQVLIARARVDVRQNSYVGAVVTDREFMSQASRLAGLDGVFQIGENNRLSVTAMTTFHRDVDGIQAHGRLYLIDFQKQGRNLRYGIRRSVVSPNFMTDLGFVRRTDVAQTTGQVSYRWWPATWLTSWGPQFQVERIDDHLGVMQNSQISTGVNAQLASNVRLGADVSRDQERYNGVLFDSSTVSVDANVDTFRAVSFGMSFRRGGQIRYIDDPYLGRETSINGMMRLRLFSRLQSAISLNTSRFVDTRSNETVFNVRIIRATSTYQFTDRWLVRNILTFDTSNETYGVNLLGTYRVNSGTAFFIGYDDHYGRPVLDSTTDPVTYATNQWQRTNRAVFAKLQVLVRY